MILSTLFHSLAGQVSLYLFYLTAIAHHALISDFQTLSPMIEESSLSRSVKHNKVDYKRSKYQVQNYL